MEHIKPLDNNPTNYCSLAAATTILATALLTTAIATIGLAASAHGSLSHGLLLGGSLCALTLDIIWMTSLCKKPPQQTASLDNEIVETQEEKPAAPTHHTSIVSTTQKKLLSDAEIIENLHAQGYSAPIEEGGDGRCLFFAILPQITRADVEYGLQSKYAQYFENWDTLPKDSPGDDKLDRLRQMALAEEEDFLNSLLFAQCQGDVNKFTPMQQQRVVELYKDMVQELEGLNGSGVHRRLKELKKRNGDSETIFFTQFSFCKNGFNQYKTRTARKFNWAGTSELIAIGQILHREVQAFGRDVHQYTRVDKQGRVLPYYASPKSSSNSPPLLIFQCNGGGHYKRLERL